MSPEFPEITKLIGKTPLVELRKLVNPTKMARVFVKLEYLNPTGSHKDRIALYMIRSALCEGKLRPGDVVVEASSGNTGISVAWLARLLGLRPVIVVPDSTAEPKKALLRALGAEVVVGSEDPSSPRYYRELARRIAEERGGVFLDQYENLANAQAHYETTAREIWEALGGEIDAFVMGVGTGGTVTGVGKFLKERRPSTLIVAVVPRGSPVAGGTVGEHIEGLAVSWVPKLFELGREYVDRVVEVSLRDAVETVAKLVKLEGILAGYSTGAHVYAALQVAEELGPGKTVVTIAADSIWRYPELVEKVAEIEV